MESFHYNFATKLLMIMICFSLLSCEKMIAIDAPINESTKENVFSTEASANGAINGLYSTFLGIFDSSAILVPSFSSDELKNNTTSDLDFYTNSLNPNNGSNSNLWARFYNLIYQSNSIIEGVQSSNTLNPLLKNQLIGEAKFIRAFVHFELVNLYGDVPLTTTTDVNVNSIKPRTNQGLVYQQIIIDLKDSQNLLTDNYAGPDRGRVNKSSATSLLARVYLYVKNYNDAESQASNVIDNSSLYHLSPLLETFVKTSKETILQITNANGYTDLGNSIIPSLSDAKVNYTYTKDFKNSIEVNDNRKNVWMNTFTFNDSTFIYPYKYRNTSVAVFQPECLVVLRLAEQYLIRAEARAQQNNLIEARKDLNMIRRRAGLDDNKQTTQAEILTSIERERRIELNTEFGHRWFDLKRTNRIDVVLNTVKSNWKTTAAFYPIPLVEINNNPYLIQNQGY